VENTGIGILANFVDIGILRSSWELVTGGHIEIHGLDVEIR